MLRNFWLRSVESHIRRLLLFSDVGSHLLPCEQLWSACVDLGTFGRSLCGLLWTLQPSLCQASSSCDNFGLLCSRHCLRAASLFICCKRYCFEPFGCFN